MWRMRFASVYQDFQDVDAFRHQIEQMQQRETLIYDWNYV
jgi:transcriptional repressor NrdR